MAKRRTRHQKETAKHQASNVAIHAQSPSSFVYVKRHLETTVSEANKLAQPQKKAEFLEQDTMLAFEKKDIVKSLLYAVVILGFEVMIYLAWKK